MTHKINKKNLYAVILVGGSGTRFWPLSRKEKPKQFIKIFSGLSLFQLTINRIKNFLPAKNIYIVTNRGYLKTVKEQLSHTVIPYKNILLEPVGKNTAPAICWAASEIHKVDPEGIMIVLPSDHLIVNSGIFLKCLMQAVSLAARGLLITMGIVPHRAETGYGYLRTKKAPGYLMVARFIEKPNLKKAEEYLKNKKYLWNSGMFVFRCEDILLEYEKYLPDIHKKIFLKSKWAAVMRSWSELPSISIDYGILEKSHKVASVMADKIGWSDVGSFASLMGMLPKDKNYNNIQGNVVALQCRHVFVRGGKKLIAVLGLKDTVVVDTPDVLLVCPMEHSQQVKHLVEVLNKGKYKKYL